MRFDLPMQYMGLYTHKGKRAKQPVKLQTILHVDIEEVETPSRPVFVLGHSRGRRRTIQGFQDHVWRRFPLNDSRAARVWRVEDALFSEYCSVEEFVERVVAETDSPMNMWAVGTGGSTNLLLDENNGEPSNYDKIVQKAPLRYWEDDDGQARAPQLLRRLQAFKIIDGMVCVKVHEPCLAIDTNDDGVRLIVAEAFDAPMDGFRDYGEARNGMRFRLDSLETAIEVGERIAWDTGKRFTQDLLIEAFEKDVYYPQEGALVHNVVSMAWSLFAPILHELPKPLALAAAAMRDALKEAPDAAATPDLVDALREMRQRMDDIVKDGDVVIPHRSAFRFMVREDQSAIRKRRAFDIEDRDIFGVIPWMDMALKEWDKRPVVSESAKKQMEWMDEALPLAAMGSGSVQQVLSRWQAHAIAKRLEMDATVLERALANGMLLLQGRIEGDSPANRKEYVAFVFDDLQIDTVVGKRGRTANEQESSIFQDFLSENRNRINERMARESLAIGL